MANPLKASTAKQSFTSGMRAAEWASIARSKGLASCADEWVKADREGWDQDHFCPLKAERLEQVRRGNR